MPLLADLCIAFVAIECESARNVIFQGWSRTISAHLPMETSYRQAQVVVDICFSSPQLHFRSVFKETGRGKCQPAALAATAKPKPQYLNTMLEVFVAFRAARSIHLGFLRQQQRPTAFLCIFQGNGGGKCQPAT